MPHPMIRSAVGIALLAVSLAAGCWPPLVHREEPPWDRLVAIEERHGGQENASSLVSPANFLDIKAQARSFAYLAAVMPAHSMLGSDTGERRVAAPRVTTDFFHTFGVVPSIGRAFVAEEGEPDALRVVILSYSLWQGDFGADANTLGRTVHLDGKPHTVVGIMGRGFNFPAEAELWTPLGWEEADWQERTARSLRVVGGLAPGRTLAEARAEMQRIATQLRQRHPDSNRDLEIEAVSWREAFPAED